jgi:5'-3' exonuclease
LISIAKVKDNNFTFVSDKPNTPLEQLLMVLPKLSLEPIIKTINPDVYNKLMMYLRVQGSSISNNYPDKVLVDMIDREYFWQSKLLFDNFDQRILKQLI